ncbi:twin-arginine translocase TatA/TatE family subunit [Flavobacterium sp. SUN046]|uniref:twin-arginine translocase TatA/TatE family subunit n=1 Tax=Flavobacterium sp. SUN046 TaxID=3002440 RepID=UPI002DB68EB0|nr:twin-arginine translocase TatA/TatE family subunit [Flavobacterium sp. SUN046]MEC4048178.1 twin-arginine translocase TatA/TatE family subunit [Flavobacterium sp. SUN046]
MGRLGMPEILVILVVVLLLFGGKKIPELMKGLGTGLKEFKDASKGDSATNTDKKEETKE